MSHYLISEKVCERARFVFTRPLRFRIFTIRTPGTARSVYFQVLLWPESTAPDSMKESHFGSEGEYDCERWSDRYYFDCHGEKICEANAFLLRYKTEKNAMVSVFVNQTPLLAASLSD